MGLVRTSLIGTDKDGTKVWRLRSGQFIGLDVEMAADVDAYVQRYPQQTGMDPALYRRQYGPVTP
jgi:hypothetical protein